MGFGGIVSRINAHARVSVLQQGSSNSTLPIAVPNPKPTAAGAIFINEANGAVLGTVALGDVGVSGSLQMYASAPGAKATVQVATHTGVVIALSGRPAASFSLAGTLTQICQQQLTDCYDASADPPVQGLSYIRGFDPNPSGAQPNTPKLRTVELLAGGLPEQRVLLEQHGKLRLRHLRADRQRKPSERGRAHPGKWRAAVLLE